MDRRLQTYAEKLVRAGLAEPGGALIGGRWGSDVQWNRSDPACEALEGILAESRRGAVVCAEPAEPYRTIIEFLAEAAVSGVIKPEDCETRLFLHDLPVLPGLAVPEGGAALGRRPGVVLKGGRVMACGADAEQAFNMYSSVCFSCFVKFFADTLRDVRRNLIDKRRNALLNEVLDRLDAPPSFSGALRPGPFTGEAQILPAMEEAGALMVETHLVDSNFGNISYYADPVLYISRGGAALDELHDRIVPVRLGDPSSFPATASTELPAHRAIVLMSDRRAILHGHPKFAVILSLDCEREDCREKGVCHLRCPHQRSIGETPIVSGEPGSGPFSLSHTVPPALLTHSGVIVYGHGLFTAGTDDFNEAFRHLAGIENACRSEFMRRIEGVGTRAQSV